MNKESKELNVFVAKAINGGYADAADGDLNPLKDFTKHLPALLAAQPGFTGLGEYRTEQSTMGIDEKKENHAVLKENMPVVPELDQYDLAAGLHGIECFFSLVARKSYEKGLEVGEKLAFQKMSTKNKA